MLQGELRRDITIYILRGGGDLLKIFNNNNNNNNDNNNLDLRKIACEDRIFVELAQHYV